MRPEKPATGSSESPAGSEIRAAAPGPSAAAWEAIAPFADAGFRAVFESSGEALLEVDPAGVIRRANARARDVLRMREASVARSSLEDFVQALPPGRLAGLGGEQSPSAKSAEARLAGGAPVRVTLRAVLPGSQHMLFCLEPEKIPEPLKQAEAELQALAESAAVALFATGGGVRLVSPRFTELIGLGPGDAATIETAEDWARLGARFRFPEVFAASRHAFAAGNTAERCDDLELLVPARRVIHRTAQAVRDAAGRTVGWLEIYHDVTGERQTQTTLLQTEKMAALGHLVSGIAHELNNPLTTIMGYAQLLLGHGLSAAQLGEARNVYQEAERARRIVKNLLYFARANQPEHSRVELNEIVERALSLRSYELRVENIAVVCELAADLPPTMADPYQLQQVVLNLLVNAEQALLEGRGHGQVHIRTRAIAGESGARLRLDLADDGPGIPPEIGSRIFDPFFTTKPPGVGTGLGLSIVYGIIQEHGGEITFSSEPGQGTIFSIDLPVVAVPAREPAVNPAVYGGSYPAAARILVVEDEPTVAQLLADVLREEGHEVEVVLDSPEGLTRLSRSHYDLVVCDLRMPRLDGRAFYEALVHAGSPARNRMLFVTGDTMARSTQQFLESTGLPHLAKPFLVEELKLAVRRLLEAGAGEREREAPLRRGA